MFLNFFSQVQDSWGSTPDAWSKIYYPKCKKVVSDIIGQAIQLGKLSGRPRANANGPSQCTKTSSNIELNKFSEPCLQESTNYMTQFEILSADFMVDTNENVWMLEFNLTPVLRDESYSKTVNDMAEIRAALEIAMPSAGDSLPKVESIDTAALKKSNNSEIWDHAATWQTEILESDATTAQILKKDPSVVTHTADIVGGGGVVTV